MSLLPIVEEIKRFLTFLQEDLKVISGCNLQYKIDCDISDNFCTISRIKSTWEDMNERVIRNLEFGLKYEEDSKASSSSSKAKSSRHTCKTCRKQFASSGLLEYHLKNMHTNNKSRRKLGNGKNKESPEIFCCQICYKSYSDEKLFQAHQSCPKKKAFSSEAPLKDHNRFICGLCDEDFRQFDRILHHLRECKGGPFTCEMCNESFKSIKLLNSHKASVHKDDLAFWCKKCDKKFKLNTSLQKHIINHHEKPKSSFSCEKCGKRFVKKVYLTNHQTRFHNLSKPLLCEICGDRFLSSSSMKKHMDIHKGVKNFTCTKCEKTFHRKDKLEFHMASHTGIRPHKCDFPSCTKSFVRKSKLMEHLRRHRGEKRFSCLVCRKMYSGSNDLRYHLLKHHPNISKNIKPHVPLTPQIIDNIQQSAKIMKSKKGGGKKNVLEEESNPFEEIDIDDLRTVNVAIQELGYHPDTFISSDSAI